MTIKPLTPFLSVAPQLNISTIQEAAKNGFKSIINNRPDNEEQIQPSSAELEREAIKNGMHYKHVPIVSGEIKNSDILHFENALRSIKAPTLAFCRTGTRSTTLWALSEATHVDADVLIDVAREAGYDISTLRPSLIERNVQRDVPIIEGDGEPEVNYGRPQTHDVVVVGGGAAGIAVTASLLARKRGLDIAIIEPREVHYYQPGWTLVGGGVFDNRNTVRSQTSVMPKGVRWVKAAASGFHPEENAVILEDGSRLLYKTLIVAAGLKLDWAAVEGLRETLGTNGVTSNYLPGLAPYTWELIKDLKEGTALFTQPTLPIKCAGAPQKAMYMACDYWRRQRMLKNIDVAFHNAGNVLFGVDAYVPALMDYVDQYCIELQFGENLVAVDGARKVATFESTDPDGNSARYEKAFDILHVCPPQCAPDFIKNSPLSNAQGWVEVDTETLQHVRYDNVYALGDVCSTPNAKTAAAVRSQAPVVAMNILHSISHEKVRALYEGYGSCPLTVERGKIVLAEFGYGGKLMPTLPFINGEKPSRVAWFLKEKLLPSIYWNLMLKGREWLVKYRIDGNHAHAQLSGETSTSQLEKEQGKAK